MSIGFLLKDRGDSVVWRGPKKDGMIRQFLAEVRWGELDYLVIDTPPGTSTVLTQQAVLTSFTDTQDVSWTGTSDEHISLLTHLHPLFLPSPLRPPSTYSPTPTSILISTPQATALNDTLKSLSFTRKLNLPVLGFVENMSGYACPCCGEISQIFSKGGGEKMAHEQDLEFLGRVPIDTKLVELLDEVSKGDIPVGQDVASRVAQVTLESPIVKGADSEGAAAATIETSTASKTVTITTFPLLDRYLETTSSQVWRGVTDKILEGIQERKDLAQAQLEGESDGDESDE